MADRTKGVSLAKGPVAIIGILGVALGLLGLLFGSTSFTVDAPSGTVTGETFLGIEGNGWTWLLFAGAGAVLLLGAPLHWGAKSMALIVGLVLAVAAVIAVIDGDDVLGVFAANGLTMLVLGAAAVALLIVALLPRVGKRRRADADEVAYRDSGERHFRRDEAVAEPAARRRP